jgi:sarcosine oxidase
MQTFDVIVLGVGGVGSAALYHLAKRGVRVLGLEQFGLAHDRGSSHGQTRLIRQTYFEHPDYVPLVQRAFDGWHALEQEAGTALYREAGLIQIGRADGEVLRGVRASAALHNLSIQNLSAREAMQRFGGLQIADDCEAVYETRAGYLFVERCVEAHVALAKQLGAELHLNESVRGWKVSAGTVVVETDGGQYAAPRLVITAGAWSVPLLAELGIPLELRRKPLYWYRTLGGDYRADAGFPGFLFDLPEGCFYGFPQIDGQGLKVAEHSGGRVITDPDRLDRELDAADESRVTSFVQAHLPRVSRERTQHAVCMYTMSPDGHFILDRHPGNPEVAFVAGLSGHGFKFAGVLGEELARLALDGKVDPRAKFLAVNRKSLHGE